MGCAIAWRGWRDGVALDRLLTLIREAAIPPPPLRRPTKPTRGSKTRRLDEKSRRGSLKTTRGRPSGE